MRDRHDLIRERVGDHVVADCRTDVGVGPSGALRLDLGERV